MMGRTMCCLLIAGSCLGLSACNTTKATIDSTVKFFSSTSPDTMFTADGMVEQKQKINLFAGVAYENLRQESAAGSGEYVTALAALYEVPAAQREDFVRVLQQRHTELFATDLKEDAQAHLKMVSVLNRVLAGETSMNR
jgi:hypothetical protein